MNLICYLFGHEWNFPMHKLVLGAKPIESKDYFCNRCGQNRETDKRDIAERTKVQNQLNEWKKNYKRK